MARTTCVFHCVDSSSDIESMFIRHDSILKASYVWCAEYAPWILQVTRGRVSGVCHLPLITRCEDSRNKRAAKVDFSLDLPNEGSLSHPTLILRQPSCCPSTHDFRVRDITGVRERSNRLIITPNFSSDNHLLTIP